MWGFLVAMIWLIWLKELAIGWGIIAEFFVIFYGAGNFCFAEGYLLFPMVLPKNSKLSQVLSFQPR